MEMGYQCKLWAMKWLWGLASGLMSIPPALGSGIYGLVLLAVGVANYLLRDCFPHSELRNIVVGQKPISFYKYGVGCLFLIELTISRFYEKYYYGWHSSTPSTNAVVVPVNNATSHSAANDDDGIHPDKAPQPAAASPSIGSGESSGMELQRPGGDRELAYCRVGSFYLRLGILMFGSAAVVQHCMRGFVRMNEDESSNSSGSNGKPDHVKEPLVAAFVMMQMVLIFNFNVSRIPRQTTIECYGYMHLLVVDVLKWAQSAMNEYSNLSKPKEYEGVNSTQPLAGALCSNGSGQHNSHAQGWAEVDHKVFGEYDAVVTAFNTEFLVATVAVLSIVWLNLNQLVATDRRWKAAVEGRVRRKKTIRITIGRRFHGMFLALLLTVCLAIGLLVHSYYSAKMQTEYAKWVLEITNGLAYTAMIAGCAVGMVVMRDSLDGKWDFGLNGAKGELLDKLLLIVGVAAELFYCVAAISGVLHEDNFGDRHEYATSFGYLLRLVQVFLQLHLIMDLNGAPHSGGRTPGRQTILFLLWANLSLFFYYCVQNVESVFETTVIGQLKKADGCRKVVALTLPFVLFYRFHSSAVLADIYKHHCCEQNGNGGGGGDNGHKTKLKDTHSHSLPMAVVQ